MGRRIHRLEGALAEDLRVPSVAGGGVNLGELRLGVEEVQLRRRRGRHLDLDLAEEGVAGGVAVAGG